MSLFFISIILKFWKITKIFDQNNKITLEISERKSHNFQDCSHYLRVSDHVQTPMVMSITNNSNSLRNVLLYSLLVVHLFSKLERGIHNTILSVALLKVCGVGESEPS